MRPTSETHEDFQAPRGGDKHTTQPHELPLNLTIHFGVNRTCVWPCLIWHGLAGGEFSHHGRQCVVNKTTASPSKGRRESALEWQGCRAV